MSTLLLSVHVVLAVLTVGPIKVAASLFRPTWQKAAADSNHYLITPGDGHPHVSCNRRTGRRSRFRRDSRPTVDSTPSGCCTASPAPMQR